MGRHFGHLKKMTSMVYFSLSPFEQRAMAGFITKGVPRTTKRFFKKIFFIAPWAVVWYAGYDWVFDTYEKVTLRKGEGGVAHH